jgi:hypothetical protein
MKSMPADREKTHSVSVAEAGKKKNATKLEDKITRKETSCANDNCKNAAGCYTS